MRRSLVAVLGLCLAGCQSSSRWQGAVEPNFTLRIHKGLFGSGMTFTSTKDDTYQIQHAAYNPATKEFTLDGFLVRQDSPAVINANIAQLQALIPLRQAETDYQRQLGVNLELAIKAGGDAVNKVLNTVAPSPFHVIDNLGSKVIDVAARPQPPASTQPGEVLTPIE